MRRQASGVAHREAVDAREGGEVGARVVELEADAVADDRDAPALREASDLRERVRTHGAHDGAQLLRVAVGESVGLCIRVGVGVGLQQGAGTLITLVVLVHRDHRGLNRRAVHDVDLGFDHDFGGVSPTAAGAGALAPPPLRVVQSDVHDDLEHLLSLHRLDALVCEHEQRNAPLARCCSRQRARRQQ